MKQKKQSDNLNKRKWLKRFDKKFEKWSKEFLIKYPETWCAFKVTPEHPEVYQLNAQLSENAKYTNGNKLEMIKDFILKLYER